MTLKDSPQGTARQWIALAAWGAAFVVGVHAHDLGRSESVVAVRGSEVRARLTLNLLEVPAIDMNGDGQVSYGELDQGIDRIYAIVKGHLSIHSAAAPVQTSLERYAVSEEHVGRLDLLLTFEGRVSQLTVTSTLHQVLRPTHEHLTSVSFDDTEDLQRALLSPGMRGATFARASDPYLATIALGLLASAVVVGIFVVQFARRALTR